MLFSDCLARSRAGDEAAQEELFGRWRALLRLQAQKLLGAELSARVDPSDVVQDSLLQASRDLEQFRGASQGEWVAWLRCIVAGQAAKVRRYHSAHRRSLAREEAWPLAGVEAPQKDVAVQLIDVEEAARIAAAIEALPEAMRQVIVRRVLDRGPAMAVAMDLGKTPAAIRSLLTQALRRLRQSLEAEGAVPNASASSIASGPG